MALDINSHCHIGRPLVRLKLKYSQIMMILINTCRRRPPPQKSNPLTTGPGYCLNILDIVVMLAILAAVHYNLG